MEENNDNLPINSCFNCKFYYFAPAYIGNPQTEFACLKGHWDSVNSIEEYQLIFEETDCVDFKIKI